LRYNDPYGWWTKGKGGTFTFGILIGFSVSRIEVWDGYGNRGIAWSVYGGGISPTISFTHTNQFSSADAITQLTEWFGLVGGSLGWDIYTIGYDFFGSNHGNGYTGHNINAGTGFPSIEIHGTFGYTWLTKEWSEDSVLQYSFSKPIEEGDDFYCWGYDDWGVLMISYNHPDTYSWEDWYGY
jgi:hypothetical protein